MNTVEETDIGLDRLPADLRACLDGQLAPDKVRALAQHDLDRGGLYSQGFLILTEDRLGHFVFHEGQWHQQWTDLGELKSAKIVEGLGVHMLRLFSQDRLHQEYRFTLRHAKEVAKLHRQMERIIEGKAAESNEPPPPPEKGPPGEDKKVRCDKCSRVIPPWSEFCPACMSRRKVLSRLLDFVKPYKVRASLGFLFGILFTVAGLARPYFSKPMFNDCLGMSTGHTDYTLLLHYIAIITGIMILGAIAGCFRERLMATLGSRIGRDIRDQTYRHLHKLSLSFFAKKPTGSLITRITSDSDRIWDFVAFTIIEAFLSVLTLVGVGVALLILNWQLALVVLTPVPLMFGLTVYFHKRLHKGFDRLWHRWSQMTSVVSDALPGVRVIKAFSQEKREVDRFGAKNNQFYSDEVQMIGLWTLYGPVMAFCSQIGAILVLIVGGYWVITRQHNMDVGTLIAFTGYMWMFYGPLHMIAHLDRMLNRAASSVQRIFEVLDTEPTIFSKHGAQPATNLQGSIELRNVSFSYDGIRRVLKNVNMTIQPGEMIGLAGPSGGGKTTLVNLVCRFYDVLDGQLLIDGKDVRDYDLETLRQHIGVVLQEPFLFHGTIAQNIAYGHPQASLEQIIEAARAANAHDFVVGFPDGYDTMVGERGATLSGGERQRISIARAILNNPRILILDEATSSVDTATEKLIQEALNRLVANRTTIAIAHRISTLRKADRLVVLENGEVKEQGSHDELAVKEDGLYAKLLRTQTELQSVIAIGG